MTNLTLPDEIPGNNQSQGWTQSDKAVHTPMWQLGIKHPAALAVLHFMVSKLSRGTNGVIISAGALSRQMGISQRTAQSAVTILQQRQFVQVLKSGNTNAYIINSKVSWQGKRGMRYASFNAQILVDEQEQTRTVEELMAESGNLREVPSLSMFEPEPDTYDDSLAEVTSSSSELPASSLDELPTEKKP